MNYSDFLPGVADIGLRNILWRLYCPVENEAMSLCNHVKSWIPIQRVFEAQPQDGDGDWIWHGKPAQWAEIRLRPKNDDMGIIFHEVFHSTFHESPLWYDSQNESWGDGFCDAFRYYMEEMQLGGQSAWSKNFKTYFGDYNRQKQDKYRGWGSLIVLHNNLDYEKFKRFWIERNKESNTPLSTILGI